MAARPTKYAKYKEQIASLLGVGAAEIAHRTHPTIAAEYPAHVVALGMVALLAVWAIRRRDPPPGDERWELAEAIAVFAAVAVAALLYFERFGD